MATIMVGSWVASALLVIDASMAEWNSTLAFLGVFEAWIIAIAAFLMVGSSMVLWGLITFFDDPSRAWKVETIGHFIVAGGWGLYMSVTIQFHPAAVVTWDMPMFTALASLARMAQIRCQERRARSLCGRR